MAAKGRYVSDRSHLTVSKPNPLNARQEAFARNIAEGRCQREAYRSAGYAPTSDDVADVNASRLLRHAQVQARVRELQAAQAEASKITAERLLAELEEARNLALGLGQAGAAVAASMGRAKLCGLLVDRREDVTRRPTRDPDEPAEVAVEVWLRDVAPQAGEIDRPSCVASVARRRDLPLLAVRLALAGARTGAS